MQANTHYINMNNLSNLSNMNIVNNMTGMLNASQTSSNSQEMMIMNYNNQLQKNMSNADLTFDFKTVQKNQNYQK